tara:strand:- start:2064 stop:2276 length:213 start_codon:yes stop_codon:yes gene_type:complete
MKENRIKINEIIRKFVDYLDIQTEYTKLMIDDYKKWEKVECCCPLCQSNEKGIKMSEKSNYPNKFKEEWQ